MLQGASGSDRFVLADRGIWSLELAIEFVPSARVLLAEGNRFHVHLITRALHEAGYEVHTVGTQAEAEAAGPSNFDAVLVSAHLEDGPGLEELASHPFIRSPVASFRRMNSS